MGKGRRIKSRIRGIEQAVDMAVDNLMAGDVEGCLRTLQLGVEAFRSAKSEARRIERAEFGTLFADLCRSVGVRAAFATYELGADGRPMRDTLRIGGHQAMADGLRQTLHRLSMQSVQGTAVVRSLEYGNVEPELAKVVRDYPEARAALRRLLDSCGAAEGATDA